MIRSGDRFSLALGGGGGRGWAHLGVARALAEAGLSPSLIVGTSMGAIVGAGLAAGYSPDAIERVARRTPVYRLVGHRARMALFDPRPVLERLAGALGDPRLEDLPIPLAVSAYDLVSGRAVAITTGRLVDAVERSIAVPLFFPACRDADGIWCDAGPWEAVPVSLARGLSPDPVIGVWVDVPKPALLTRRPVAALLRAAALRLAPGGPIRRLTARRYLALLAERWADPVHEEAPDLLIRPRLGMTPAWHFTRVHRMASLGYRDAVAALAAAGLAARAEASVRERGAVHAA
ncbi:MAG: patatin-like phospholipase family protein [Candidatus Limnocylindria bacterium]